MHKDVTSSRLGDEFPHSLIRRASGNIINNICPGFYRRTCHPCVARIHREQRLRQRLPQSLEHRYNACDLLLFRDRLRTGAGGLSTNVQYLRPGLPLCLPASESLIHSRRPASSIERVRRHIDNAHHQRHAKAYAPPATEPNLFLRATHRTNCVASACRERCA